MAERATVATTQRAYTLRLRGMDKSDNSWRDALWATHEAVNSGAKVFGDWLLTLRGGLSHKLADKPDVQGEPPSEQERKNRRILLALSWLSVEDRHGAPADFIVEQPVEALRTVLAARGLGEDELGSWIEDCSPSLSAHIREDAAWVNRSDAFDQFRSRTGGSADREYACRVVLGFLELKGPYFHVPSVDDDSSSSPAASGDDKPLVNEATGWLCDNWGVGKKTDKARVSGILDRLGRLDFDKFVGKSSIELLRFACQEIGLDAAEGAAAHTLCSNLIAHIGWQGRPSSARMALEAISAAPNVTDALAQRLTKKLRQEAAAKLEESGIAVPSWMPDERVRLERAIGLAYRDGKDRTFEFAVMLDHALRRVSGAHSWIKLAEGERRKFAEDAAKLQAVPAAVRELLNRFCEDRGGISGAVEAYRIRKRAIGGWDQIVAAWRACPDSEEARIDAARRVQAEWEDTDGKFGDIQLFEALATDDAKCVWENGPQPLQDYVAATTARADQLRFKVPAYRHPDPLRHPVFCDFGNSRWTIKFAVHERHKLNGGRPRKNVDADWLRDDSALSMQLWNGEALAPKPMRWSCKRLVNDLAIKQKPVSDGDAVTAVTRADRLGRAAAGATRDQQVRIANIFDEKDWNGRLQAPRVQLDAIARHVDRCGWDAKAQTMLRRIRWLVSFSPKLTPRGPWVDYCSQFDDASATRPFVSGKGEYAVKHAGNEARQGHARLILSRLPGLRVLSVDLGHRFAAACAVWQTITARQMEEACRTRGHQAPSPDDLFIHLKRRIRKTVKDKEREVEQTDVYRRIGPDRLPDGTEHPAPWARLERQFVIRLQGEGNARRATRDERDRVKDFETHIGFRNAADERMPSMVDELQFHALRLARLGIARHARRAKIAWALTSLCSLRPGGGQECFAEGSPEHAEHLTRCLMDWHAMAAESRWNDSQMRDLWNQNVAAIDPDLKIVEPPIEPPSERPTRQEREKNQNQTEERIRAAVGRLTIDSRTAAAGEIARRWNDDDARWREHLRWLRSWLLPRGLKKDKARARLARRMGGLSLTRIAAFKSLYQVQKAFFMRPDPANPRKRVPSPGDESLERFGQRVLDAMERLRDQRVKQLASRIAEAALGIGAEGIPGRRPDRCVHDPCHAIVIEDLTHYRPDDLQTRRENRQLMDWSSSKVRKHLSEACQLHGLHLREVSPAYTSRQSSRTGLPGVRCQDVSIMTFLKAPHWRKRARVAKERLEAHRGGALDCYLCELDEQLSRLANDRKSPWPPLRLPVRGGDLFVSVDGHTVQADLNAAANIGLRALLDPDFGGRWWYVPCNSVGKPLPEKVKGCPLFTGKPLTSADANPPTPRPAGKGRKKGARTDEPRTINLWRNPVAQPPESTTAWTTFDRFWPNVEAQVVKALQQQNEHRARIARNPLEETPF